jgi:MFS family permease
MVSVSAPTTAGRLSHAASFAAVAAIFVLFAAASSAPSPLYVVYQAQWGFSSTTLTGIFAVYVVGLVGALLSLGALSDHIGRRPVLAASIGLEAVALLLFVFAGDVSILFVARFLQGIATGTAMTTLGAALVDLNPPHAPGRAGVVNGIVPVSGLALGSLGTGALVQYAPAPTHLVWALLLGGMALSLLIVLALPETSTRKPGGLASLTPKLGVPQRLRAEVVALVPILVASWALGGLYLSLGPSVAAGVFGLTNHLIGGLVVTLLCGTGAVTAYVLRRRPVAWVLGFGAALLTVGSALTLVGVLADSVVLGIVGTVVSGVGFGASALASFATLARIASPAERGELFAVAYTIAYVAFSLPAVAAGLAATTFGLHSTTVVYSAAVIALGLAAILGTRRLAAR